MKKIIDWKKHHNKQLFSGWCGVAVAKTILSIGGIKKSQLEIACFILKQWWGTSPDLLVAYLSRFFKVNFKRNGTVSDIRKHLKAGHIVAVNWWDNGGGHWSIVSSCDRTGITMIDSSSERNWMHTIPTSEFKKIWWDTLDVNDRLWHEGFMLWVSF
jgi:hypothetical protein